MGARSNLTVLVGMAGLVVGCGTQSFSETRSGVDVQRRPVGRTASTRAVSMHAREDHVSVDVVRAGVCEEEITRTTTTETTRGRRTGGAGRTAEWVVVGVGLTAMVGGVVLNATEPEPTQQDGCCNIGRGTVAFLGGFVVAGYAAMFLGLDHVFTYESTSRATVGATRERVTSPCGEAPAVGAEVTLHLPSGPVQGRTDASGRATMAVLRSAFGPRTGRVTVPLLVDGRLVGEVVVEIPP